MIAPTVHLQASDVLLELQVKDRRQLFEAIGQHVERGGGPSAESVASALLRREQLGSTGLGDGVAIPHARVRTLERIRAFYVRPHTPLAFDAPDHRPVIDIMVLLVPHPAAQAHLEVLAEMVSRLANPSFRETLHRCNTPELVLAHFRETVVPVPANHTKVTA